MATIRICAPSRIYSSHPNGSFSTVAMVDYMADIGFDGVDMSLEGVSASDDSYKSILYAARRRADERGLAIPSCHLPFYMPEPSDPVLMGRFSRDICAALDAAGKMEIPLAVIHPIALHAARGADRQRWLDMNTDFLSPICEHARRRGIELCIENMASSCEGSGDHLFGSSADEILELCIRLGTGACWDCGHANISGVSPTSFTVLGERLRTFHAHDNSSHLDSHSVPFDGCVDWDAVARGLSDINYCGYINIEIRAWDVPSDRQAREEIGRRALYAGQRLARMAENS